MLSTLLFLLSLSLLSPSSASAAAASWFSLSLPSIFPSHRFTSEHLIDISSLGLPKTGLISSWGDFNNDQLNDLVHLSYDQRSLSVWTWDRKGYVWKEDREKRIKTKGEFVVTNVVTGDFNFDGKVDLLVYGEKNPGDGGWWGSKKDKTTEMKVYLQNATGGGGFSEPYDLESSTLPQAIPVSLSSSLKTSLLGFLPSSSSTTSPTLWENSYSPVSNSTLFTSTPLSNRLDYSTHPSGDWNCQFPLSTPHFNSFIDLDGDCMADLFFTCLVDPEDEGRGLRYEVWTNEKLDEEGEGGKFVWRRGGDLPKGTKSVGFADMDRDGTIDMILSVCPHEGNNKDCSIQIAYNDQIPLCTSSSKEDEECRDLENLCTKDEEFKFPDLTSSTVPNPSLSILPISSLIPSHNLVTSSLSFRGSLPTPPQVGDYNIDGYPDLLVLVSPTSHSSQQQRLAKLLRSFPCERGKCSDGEIELGRRRWELVSGQGTEALEKFKDVESVGWVDLDDDGSLDIVVQRTGQSGAARQINFIKNNFFNDAFFLKAMMLNGACNGWCEPKESGQSRYRPYGTSYSGASFKFTVLDPTGARRSTQYGQLSQTSYLSLPLPYAHLGLGRTNNYVENLFIGSPRSAQPQHYINLEGVIPNSQVLVIPWQSREGENGDVGEWKKELYLKPGDWIPWVTVVILTGILGLGIVVLVLHLNEKREDEIERRARLLSLNFQAL